MAERGGTKRFGLVPFGLLVAALFSCANDDGYSLVLLADGREVVDEAYVWEVAIVDDDCEGSFEEGDEPDPTKVLEHVRWRSGDVSPEVGTLFPGRYAFYARVFDDHCNLRFGGCVEKNVVDHGTGRIEIPIGTVSGGAVCVDDLSCNGSETCDPDVGCVRGQPVDCRDNFDCTIDSCIEPSGGCTHEPDDELCKDNQTCTAVGCMPRLGCDGDQACQDGRACNGAERCVLGVCFEASSTPCDGTFLCPINRACGPDNGCADRDEDGYPCGEDCNDRMRLVHPGATEVCGNHVDDNCDGNTDEGCP